MFDLRDQLSSYLDHVIERVDIEDIIEAQSGDGHVRPLEPLRPTRRSPIRATYAVAAAAVTLLLIGGVAWLLSTPGIDDSPIVTPIPATTTPTTAELSSVTGALEWQAVVDFAADVNTFFSAPIVQVGTDDRFYMLGLDLRLWVSDDGFDWMQYGLETPDDLTPLLQPGRISAFSVGGDMLALQLAETIGTGHQDGTTIAVYDLSTIGLTDAGLGFLGSLSLPTSEEQDVTVGPAGVLVNAFPFQDLPSAAVEVWRSADGSEWTLVSGLEATTNVTATSEGFYALSDELVDSDGVVRRDLYFSPNGVDWSVVHSFSWTHVELERWGDEALAVIGSVYSLSPNGIEHRVTPEYSRDDDGATFGSALGIVQIDAQRQRYLYSPPGSPGQFVDFPESDFRPWPNTLIAMNSNAVLIGMRSPTDLQQPTEQWQLWRGTPRPID